MNKSKLASLPHAFSLKLQAVYDTLKSAERKAADFLVEHGNEVQGLTIVDYAQRAGCSEATIVRLSKRLGYEGYPELKADFATSYADHAILDYRGLDTTKEPFAVMKKVLESTALAVLDTAGAVDAAAYTGALDALCSAETIMLAGVGDAAVVAQEAYLRLVRIGHPAMFSTDHDIQLIMASQLKPGDVFLAVSHSGQTRSLIAVAREAEKSGAKLVSITNYPFSQLAKRSHFVLQTAVFTSYVSGEVMSKRIAQLCIIESLYVNFMIRKGEPYLSRLATSNEVVKQNKL